MRRDNPEAHKLWFFTRKGVRTHEEPNLMGFFICSDRTFHDSREPAWAAGENTLVEVSPACEPRSLSVRDYTRGKGQW